MDSDTPTHSLDTKPYQGLVPFTEDQADYFFGRESDTRVVAANLFASQFTLLYGESGVGKSSLLRAGLLHSLKTRGNLLPIYFRDWPGDPIHTFASAVAAACARAGVSAPPRRRHSRRYP